MAANWQHKFYIDMNAVRADQVGTLLSHAKDPVQAQLVPPQPGDLVLAYDDDEDEYFAFVNMVVDGWVSLTIDWESCVSGTAEFVPVTEALYDWHVRATWDPTPTDSPERQKVE